MPPVHCVWCAWRMSLFLFPPHLQLVTGVGWMTVGTTRQSAASRSKPIAIPRAAPRAGPPAPGSAAEASLLSQSLPPRAPVIGSLPSPKFPKGITMPDLALPAASPQAVSFLVREVVCGGWEGGKVEK